jgi:hypothetical protein
VRASDMHRLAKHALEFCIQAVLRHKVCLPERIDSALMLSLQACVVTTAHMRA